MSVDLGVTFETDNGFKVGIQVKVKVKVTL